MVGEEERRDCERRDDGGDGDEEEDDEATHSVVHPVNHVIPSGRENE